VGVIGRVEDRTRGAVHRAGILRGRLNALSRTAEEQYGMDS
jgi:hypothetical protein